jgi:hypothetical protein
MSAAGITLSVGAPGVGASLAMQPAGITLAFAAWKITLDAGGIMLSTGSNVLKVTPSSIALNGMQIQLNAISALLARGGVTKIG